MENKTDDIEVQVDGGGQFDRDFFGSSTKQFEEFCRSLIARGEGPKVDLKQQLNISEAKEKVEFCKDLSSIANSEDAAPHLRGYGFIIVGVDKTGTVVGGVESLGPSRRDGTSASLTQIAGTYLAPVPRFDLVTFEDVERGPWGVIVIHPSISPPHIFIRELSGDPSKNEWFVRVNDVTQRAGIGDYARILQGAATRATRPLEAELKQLGLKLDRLEDSGNLGSLSLLQALQGAGRAQPEHEEAPTAGGQVVVPSLAATIRRTLGNRLTVLGDQLVEEALKLRAVMDDERPENPQAFPGQRDVQNLLKPIEYMERESRPFVEAVASVVRYDKKGELFEAVREAFQVIAVEPNMKQAHWQYASALRCYPAALSLYAISFVSAGLDDARLLRSVLDLSFERENGLSPMIEVLRFTRAAADWFKGALQQGFNDPVAERCFQVLPPWLRKFVPAKPAERVFYQSEFGLALEYTRYPAPFNGRATPLRGRYLYGYTARSSVERMLRSRSKYLVDLFGDEVGGRLADFDENAQYVVPPGSFGEGFTGGAQAAWAAGIEDRR